MATNWKLLKTCSLLMLMIILFCTGCASSEEHEVDESTKYEVDGVIFENDLMSITGVSADEYLEVFKTKEITYTYFAKDFSQFRATNILNLGGTFIAVIPGEYYLENLDCSVLKVIEDDQETIITDKLEEFFICQNEDGSMAVYYETYHLYDEKDEGNSIKMYVTLKAYKIEFTYYTPVSEPKVEII